MEHEGMVHALREIWRALKPGGLLLDLRPLAANMPVEILGVERTAVAGYLDTAPEAYADDRAADAALVTVEREGLFAREREGAFDFLWYWDTPEEMQAFIAEKWTDTRLPEEVLVETRRLMAETGDNTRVRTSANVIISRWRRLER